MPKMIADKLLSWASLLEDNTRDQAAVTAALPWVTGHLALMPDAHLGKGATIGSVIATEDVVMPAAVGVDIGCGMAAARTFLTRADLLANSKGLGELRNEICRRIPLGPGQYREEPSERAAGAIEALTAQADSRNVDLDRYKGKHSASWQRQLGTLGGGNHFIELCLDEQDRVWVFLHSGSRGVGNKIATYHTGVARKLCERWHVDLPDPELAFLPVADPAFREYVNALRWAQAFAAANREEMLWQCLHALRGWSGSPDARPFEMINCHHNYTTVEHHMGRRLWITRKGAIRAGEGEPGLIPGSMGTRSYVVAGKGNPASYCSAPHGAGRVMSRKAARERFTGGELAAWMSDAGIVWRDNIAGALVDEHPESYKPIDQVMADAADLVEIRHTLRQVLNVKGET